MGDGRGVPFLFSLPLFFLLIIFFSSLPFFYLIFHFHILTTVKECKQTTKEAVGREKKETSQPAR